jgi:hypothetical protein
MKQPIRSAALAAVALAVWFSQPSIAGEPYRTTYGEDPIPGARLLRGPYRTTYGQDPVPDKSLSQRWWEYRNRPSRLANFKGSQVVETPPGGSALVPSEPKPPADVRPRSSRRQW